MSYFPAEMPRPEPDRDDCEFWRNCAQQQLRFQACTACGTPRHPPRPICHRCHSMAIEWEDPGARATLYTYCVIHHPNHPAVVARVPYIVGVVEFPALSGVRLVTNVTDVAPADARIGMELSLWWDDIGDGMFVPRFRPLPAASLEARDTPTPPGQAASTAARPPPAAVRSSSS